MTCLESQSKIMAFIEGKLPDDELKEFIKHVRNCDNCSEELEIYYTLIVGMKQLDNEENLSTNFKNELNAKMNDEMTRMTAVKRIATSTIVVVLAAIVACLVWIYSGILDKVYNYEQNAKYETQTEYFYSDTFGNELFYNSDYMTSILEARLNNDEDEKKNLLETDMDFIYKVKKYNATHKTYIEVAEDAAEKGNDEDEEVIDY